MSLPRVVAIYSPAPGCGKSTVAGHLGRRYGYIPVSFALPLKQMLLNLMGSAGIPDAIAVRYVFGDLKEAPIPQLGGVSARYLMQTLGTEWGRELISQDLWVCIAQRKIRGLLANGAKVVVDDLRRLNEYRLIRWELGHILKVVRPSYKDETGHTSEGALDGVAPDSIIHNSQGIPELHASVDAWLKTFHSSTTSK